MSSLYQFFIFLFGIIVRILSVFNPKIRKWHVGRINWQKRLAEDLSGFDNVIWFHCSSLGEFEQGRPLLESFMDKGENVLLTFFSPSGYEHISNKKLATVTAYIPLDSRKNARIFIEIVNPKFAVFVKYEFWFNHLRELRIRRIPTFLVSGIFRKNQHFFKWYGKWFSKQLSVFSHVFVQNQTSKHLLNSINLNKVTISGDTRFDRVIEILNKKVENINLKRFSENQFTLIAGSTWPADEKLIFQLIKKHPELQLILAPHDVSEERLSAITEACPVQYALLSQISNQKGDERVLIIDSIGLLSSTYQYGQISFIGGGFGSGIHNTLEAAVNGIPVIFGPNYKNFQEAIDLIDIEAAYSISNYEELENCYLNMSMVEKRKIAGNKAIEYIKSKSGATQMVLDYLKNENLIDI